MTVLGDRPFSEQLPGREWRRKGRWEGPYPLSKMGIQVNLMADKQPCGDEESFRERIRSKALGNNAYSEENKTGSKAAVL